MGDEDFVTAVGVALAAEPLRAGFTATWSYSWVVSVPVSPRAHEADRAIEAPPPPIAQATPAPTGAIEPVRDDAATGAADGVPLVGPFSREDAIAPVIRRNGRRGLAVTLIACALLTAIGWRFAALVDVCRLADRSQLETAGRLAAAAMAGRIVTAESGGDATARNRLSSATGTGQFLDGTWLDMIRAYRPELAERHETEILALRRDPELSREMVARFAERNAAMLVRRCLPVTPGTLYLAHFAGGGGAVAVLSAPEDADAAAIMADADSTGRTTREMIVTANPFLDGFTVADLKKWADRKMATGEGSRLSAM